MWYSAAGLVVFGCAIIGLLALVFIILAVAINSKSVLDLDWKWLLIISAYQIVAIGMIITGLINLI